LGFPWQIKCQKWLIISWKAKIMYMSTGRFFGLPSLSVVFQVMLCWSHWTKQCPSYGCNSNIERQHDCWLVVSLSSFSLFVL
jgi:hypothetical protein